MANDRTSREQDSTPDHDWTTAYIAVAVFSVAMVGLLYWFSRYFGG